MDEMDLKNESRLTALEASCKSAHKRLDEQSHTITQIHEIVVEMRHMREDLNATIADIAEIKQKPAKRWDSVIAAILGALGGGVGAALIALLMR